ncbi:MAG: hydroxymethylglutaryl-CoA reductase, partial [Halobacteria archaeon]|nr:hydroxymethylglutaryl-CoA reductase [Halobacteria archaeon]
MIERFLERLFTWESLENTERGVEFELKNRLDDADFAGIAAVEIDDEEVPPEDVRLETDDGVYGATEITADDPLHFPLAETAQVVLETRRLRLGVHELRVVLRIEGFGEVGFTTEDEIT